MVLFKSQATLIGQNISSRPTVTVIIDMKVVVDELVPSAYALMQQAKARFR